MTASAVTKFASAGPGAVAGTTSGVMRGLGRGARSTTGMPQSSQGAAQGFGSSWRSILAAAGIPEDGAEASAKAEPASTDGAQAQRRASVAGAPRNDTNLPPTVRPQQAESQVTARTDSTHPLSADAQPAVRPERAPAQAPGQPIINALKAGTTASTRDAQTAHVRMHAKREPHPAKPAEATAAQLSPLMDIIVPVPAHPVHPPAQSATELTVRSAIHSSRPGLHAFSIQTEMATLTGTRSVPAPTATNSAPAQTKRAPDPAFDQAIEAPSIGPEAQAISAGKEPTEESSVQAGTSMGASQASYHAPAPADSVVAAQALRGQTADHPASGIVPPNPHREASGISVPVETDGKAAPGARGVTAKSAESHWSANALHMQAAQAAHPVASQASVVAQMQPATMAARDASATNFAGDAKERGETNASSPSATADPSAVRETFASLDAAVSTSAPTWIHASPHHAEAGFKDPALGWVAVRAQTDANGIHAALVPGSADAAQSLGTHLAGLNAHLAERHTPVATLTLAAQESQWAGQGMGQDAGQNAGQGGHSGQEADARSSASAAVPASQSHGAMTAGRTDAPSAGTMPGGAYISVMA
ncbi:MAG: hypothetical protein KGM96_13580 [Acidobacteriota bacterium]|nr:hypothetical protein [Acidobacteriota bacterium]